ncbi:MAG: tannase/feruloyl esterase family alpha/beta hydrolase [Steroidobacteraceae bacterium]
MACKRSAVRSRLAPPGKSTSQEEPLSRLRTQGTAIGTGAGSERMFEAPMLAALEQWVEHGRAPTRILASRIRGGRIDRTRPLCPYPEVAVYKGSGSTDQARSFVCRRQR